MRVDDALGELPIQRLQRGQAGYPSVLTAAAAAVRGFDAPPVLSLWGKLPVCAPHAPCVAIVGSRACTQAGRQFAAQLGAALAQQGVVVVSGAARGIDQAAMQGAQAAGGKVVAVLGSGLACPYPRDGLPLLWQMATTRGAVLSEFDDGASPRRHHFPQRNRLIAALSQVVVVVQGGERSGTMNTVQWALELGRDVGAVPGIPGQPCSAGPHRLLRQGAFLVDSPQDVLAVLGLSSHPPTQAAQSPRARVLDALTLQASSLPALQSQLSLSPDQLRTELATLELEGLIHRAPGGAYHRRS